MSSVDSSTRPRLLLVPQLTELEWLIKPQLEEWAEVASYDAPGVGEEPPVEPFTSETVGERGLQELERRGWERCVVVADEFGVVAALYIATTRPEAVEAVALGHARLSNEVEGESAPLNSEVFAALAQLVSHDHRTFVRQLFRMTAGELQRGGYHEDLVERYLERVPLGLLREFFQARPHAGGQITERVRSLDVPTLLAQHEGCLLFTNEGFDAAVDALPAAQAVKVPEKPSGSEEFAGKLRAFCAQLASSEPRVTKAD